MLSFEELSFYLKEWSFEEETNGTGKKNNEENRNGFNVRGKEDTCRILKAISYYNK